MLLLALLFVVVFIQIQHCPGRISVISPLCSEPQNSIQCVLVSLINFFERRFKRYIRPVKFSRIFNVGKLRIDAIQRDIVHARARARDRIMICCSPGLNKDMRAILEAKGFKEGSTTTPGDYVVERAFVEQ